MPRPDYSDRVANLTERTADLTTLPDARALLGALADSVEGLGADPAPNGQENFWYDIVCPEWKDMRSSRLYVNMPDWDVKSSCALVARSHLRRLGLRLPCIGLDADNVRHAYVDQSAVGDIYVAGGTTDPRRAGAAWVVAGTDLPPENVIALIGEGGAEHVFVTRKITDTSSESIDGGQPVGTIPHTNPPKAYQGILRRTRTISVRGGRLYFDSRPLIGWLDPNLLELAAPATYDFV